MGECANFVRIVEGGFLLSLRVTPKAASPGIGGIGQGANGHPFLKVRVSAAPEKGKANSAVLTLLAKRLGVAKSRLSVVIGDTDRNKVIRLEAAEDMTADDVLGRLTS